MELNKELYKGLIRKLEYAIRSDVETLVAEVYGRAAMAEELGAITFEQYMKISSVAIRCFSNIGKHRREKALKQFEETDW